MNEVAHDGYVQANPEFQVQAGVSHSSEEVHGIENNPTNNARYPFKKPFKPNNGVSARPVGSSSFLTEARCYKCGKKGHLQPDCTAKVQTTLGRFASFKATCEKHLKELQQRMEHDSTTESEKEVIMDEMTKRLKQIQGADNSIKIIEEDASLNL